VHVRQYMTREDGTMFPTKVGVCLGPMRYANLMNLSDNIVVRVEAVLGDDEMHKDEAMSTKIHVGGGLYVSADTEFRRVHIRQLVLQLARYE